MESERFEQNEERTFFFSFPFHFSKQQKFSLGLPKWKFSTWKKHFTAGKKSGKMTFSCYALMGPVHVSVMSVTGPVLDFG